MKCKNGRKKVTNRRCVKTNLITEKEKEDKYTYTVPYLHMAKLEIFDGAIQNSA